MREFAPQMVQWQDSILRDASTTIEVVPVSIFWARTPHREKFFWRNLVRENYGPTAALRRVLSILFTRKSALVAFGKPINWQEISNAKKSLNWNLRHIGIYLRKEFKETRHVALGPDLVLLDQTVERVVSDVEESKQIHSDLTNRRVRKKLKKTVRRIATRMSYPVMMLLRWVVGLYLKRAFDGLELLDSFRLQSIAKTHTLVYAPSHRSQTDYLALSYILFQHGFAIPHIASGENLDIPIVGPMLRRSGAFFMRRTFRDDPTYEQVLATYLHLCVEQGSSIEFFVEGGRSRTGLMLPPRFGLLNMVMASRARGLPRPIAVIPIYIGYESIPDTKDYITELSGKSKSPEKLKDVVLSLRLLRSRLGRIQLHVAEPIKLDEFVSEDSLKDETERLGYAVTQAINNAAIVNPINLVGLVVLTSPTHCVDEDTLVQHLSTILELLHSNSNQHDLVLPRESPLELINRCFQLGLIQREFSSNRKLITCSLESAQTLTWFRNNILHTVAVPGLLATLLLNQDTPSLSVRQTVEMASFLLPFISRQLHFGVSLRDIRRWIESLEKLGLLARKKDDTLQATQTLESRETLRLLANLTLPMLKRFYVLLKTSMVNKDNGMDRDQLVNSSLKTSKFLARLRGDELPIFVERQFFWEATETLVSRQVLIEDSEGWVRSSNLAESILERAREIFPQDYLDVVERYVRP